MGIFGWSLPPGCGTLPCEEANAEDITALVTAIAPLPAGVDAVYWDEDGNVIEGYTHTVPADPHAGIPEHQDRAERTVLTVEWEDIEGDDFTHNAAKAAREYVEHTQKKPPPEPLAAFRHGDGAHCGLADWYDDKQGALQVALEAHAPFDTGWYSSKKEIASARISSMDGTTVRVEVSVSDDFDTGGSSSAVAAAWTLEAVIAAIDDAWSDADGDKEDNEPYTGFSVHDSSGAWIETYLLSDGTFDSPPGDNYFNWGWQHDEADGVGVPDPRIPADAVAAFEAYANDFERPAELTVAGWTIRPWS